MYILSTSKNSESVQNSAIINQWVSSLERILVSYDLALYSLVSYARDAEAVSGTEFA